MEWVLGVYAEPAVQRSGRQVHDFDLFEGGRRTGALVVARSTRRSSSSPWGSMRRQRWDAGGRRSWVVRLGSVSRSGPDERMIVGLLTELEDSGGTGFRRADQVRVAALRAAGVRLSPAERVLEDLEVFGVVAADSQGGEGMPTVVAKAPEPTFTSPEAINEAVEDEAWRPGNRDRLAGSGTGAADCHLFIWLDPADIVAHAAMDPDAVAAPPLLAPETTVLWVARRPRTTVALADRVWQTNAFGEWEALGSIVNRRVLAPTSGG